MKCHIRPIRFEIRIRIVTPDSIRIRFERKRPIRRFQLLGPITAPPLAACLSVCISMRTDTHISLKLHVYTQSDFVNID